MALVWGLWARGVGPGSGGCSERARGNAGQERRWKNTVTSRIKPGKPRVEGYSATLARAGTWHNTGGHLGVQKTQMLDRYQIQYVTAKWKPSKWNLKPS